MVVPLIVAAGIAASWIAREVVGSNIRRIRRARRNRAKELQKDGEKNEDSASTDVSSFQGHHDDDDDSLGEFTDAFTEQPPSW
mmetsp:Transcript_16272/g.37392  ORF Transcript_16272/g.37392 Transcript_16272/m.37392 type:complete len:83 (+) Transcript_16272:120-368(+)|eukprot:CAMPEP_0116835806 /NCGR_PEP_ID=MMETSP0418-20121206/7745_1 /TAXON_ID=1158023 /ORGANISM="Astrosyne radiata, Strain 13vi08-1A" /LENGTH=82 /DNA_ID=CAMNT_0004465505 /DNA_START=107 /DNA_END=352 /DNA_ORIENTATION=+